MKPVCHILTLSFFVLSSCSQQSKSDSSDTNNPGKKDTLVSANDSSEASGWTVYPPLSALDENTKKDKTIKRFSPPTIEPNQFYDDAPPPVMEITNATSAGSPIDEVGMATEADVDTKIYDMVDQEAEFIPVSGLEPYIYDHLIYPEALSDKAISGTTFVSFVVNTDGKVNNIQIVKSSGYSELDNEAIKLIIKMPKWKPALLKGMKVRSRKTLPIQFESE